MKQQIKVLNYDKNGALIEDLNKVSVPREILNNIANILNMEVRESGVKHERKIGSLNS